jgi:hypothetical protein
MARVFFSLFVLVFPILTGWSVLYGVDPMVEARPWWQYSDGTDIYHQATQVLVGYFGPTPVGVGLIALGPVAAALMFFVIKPRSLFPRRPWPWF